MKILCVFGKHHYGRPALGIGIEYAAFTSALRRLGHEVVHFESWDRSLYCDYAGTESEPSQMRSGGESSRASGGATRL